MAVQHGHKMTENTAEKQKWLLCRISRTVQNATTQNNQIQHKLNVSNSSKKLQHTGKLLHTDWVKMSWNYTPVQRRVRKRPWTWWKQDGMDFSCVIHANKKSKEKMYLHMQV